MRDGGILHVVRMAFKSASESGQIVGWRCNLVTSLADPPHNIP